MLKDISLLNIKMTERNLEKESNTNNNMNLLTRR